MVMSLNSPPPKQITFASFPMLPLPPRQLATMEKAKMAIFSTTGKLISVLLSNMPSRRHHVDHKFFHHFSSTVEFASLCYYCRDKNEGAHPRSGEGGKILLRDAGSDSRLGRDEENKTSKITYNK